MPGSLKMLDPADTEKLTNKKFISGRNNLVNLQKRRTVHNASLANAFFAKTAAF